MKVVVTDSFEETGRLIADMFIALLAGKPNARLGLATGSTAEPVYRELVREYQAGKVNFSRASTVNLDEYVGLAPDHPQSYRASMDRWLFDHVNVDKSRTLVASGLGDPNKAVAAFRAAIAAGGPADLQLLGIGVDGHIAFNEPAPVLCAHAHRVGLLESTIEANARFFASRDEVPKEAITMGMADIFSAKAIVLAATGSAKAEVMRRLLLTDDVDPMLPASMLKLHPAVTVVIDRALAGEIGYVK